MYIHNPPAQQEVLCAPAKGCWVLSRGGGSPRTALAGKYTPSGRARVRYSGDTVKSVPNLVSGHRGVCFVVDVSTTGAENEPLGQQHVP